MDRVKGKVVIITGGAGDLGGAAASLLAKGGRARWSLLTSMRLRGRRSSKTYSGKAGRRFS